CHLHSWIVDVPWTTLFLAGGLSEKQLMLTANNIAHLCYVFLRHGEDERSSDPHPVTRACCAHASNSRADHPAFVGGRYRSIDDGRLHLLRRYGRPVEGPAAGGFYETSGPIRDGAGL